MRQAANESTTTFPRALLGPLTAAIACGALLAACSSASHSARHVGKARPTTASTTTRPTTTTTIPLANYRVRRGDTLTSIAKRFRVPIAVIVFVNGPARTGRLIEGQVLRIPPTPPLILMVTPSEGPPGRGFQLSLTGSKPSEMFRFEIDSPTGKYTGRPHVASVDGAVKAKYQTSVGDPTGIYKVVANGNQGTTAQASFRVVEASAPHT